MILILLENKLTQHILGKTFTYISKPSKLLLKLQETIIAICSRTPRWLALRLKIEYVIENELLQIVKSQLYHIVNTIHLPFNQGCYLSSKLLALYKLIIRLRWINLHTATNILEDFFVIN